jgi:glycogen operon protein
VSYNERHNLANGEGNRDGSSHNLSRNGGVEGETDDPAVNAWRAGRQRVLLAALLLSQGTPMLLAGDEIGHTQRGNNNAYCQDNATAWLDWTKADAALTDFVRRTLALRREAAPLRSNRWWPAEPTAGDPLHWLTPEGSPMTTADWERSDRPALTLLFDAPPDVPGAVAWLVLIQAGDHAIDFTLPPGPWLRRLASDDDTAAPRRLAGRETLAPASLWLAQRLQGADAGATLN